MNEKKRIVVKLGTSTLTHPSGKLNLRRMEKIVRALADLQGKGNDIILVTSAAISAGTAKMRLEERPTELRMKMAIAAVGQARLMHIYDTLFSEYNRTVAQILLSGDNVDDEAKEKNLSNTFEALLEMGVIPIVNENDSVSSAEIEVGHQRILGDNDTLSAIVARLTHADLLILMSDIEGLYSSDPRKNPDARLLHEVHELSPAIMQMAGGAGTLRGTGGMQTKLTAAKIAMDAGFDMVITNNKRVENLYDIVDGKPVGTRFTRLQGD
jgi:glutamate 5-kinase